MVIIPVTIWRTLRVFGWAVLFGAPPPRHRVGRPGLPPPGHTSRRSYHGEHRGPLYSVATILNSAVGYRAVGRASVTA
jgi:hypothetical protein